MATGFLNLPDSTAYRLTGATVPAALLDGPAPDADSEGLVRRTLFVADGRLTAIEAAAPAATDTPVVNLDGAMVWPCFVDMHTHLDKGHIARRQPNADGTFDGALDAVERDRTHWRAEDIATRMDFALRCAYAHGTAVLRTHLDSVAPQHHVTWPVFAEVRAAWAGRIDLQGVSLVPIDALRDTSFARDLTALVKDHGGVFGAVTYMTPDLDDLLDATMRRAADAGLDLDFHVDETTDPAARSLRAIADAVRRTGFPGRVVAGHCCSLAAQPEAEAAETMAAIAEAGIAVVSLPMCNLYLQDRAAGRTPRLRGVTLLRELAAAGVATAVASDNTRDPFYAYGDLDMLEVLREAVRTGHLDHPITGAERLVTRAPSAIIGANDRGVLRVGGPADLVVVSARDYGELLSRPQADRTVIRNGRTIDRRLPDYRELDSLMEPAG